LSGIYAQNKYNTFSVTDTIPINFNNVYSISSVSIIPFSEKITLRNSVIQPLSDYRFDYLTATFTLSDSLPYSIFDTLFVTYETIKLGLKKEYKKRSLVLKYDEKLGDTVQVVQTESGGFTPESIFGPGLQKSGTLIRGFTIGTTKDFSWFPPVFIAVSRTLPNLQLNKQEKYNTILFLSNCFSALKHDKLNTYNKYAN